MNETERAIFHDYLQNHIGNCFCSLSQGKCKNCDSKETLLELWKKLEGADKI